ncbi:SDR family NAD(P)-dependent oxidoreductase [Thalassotalea euphylliae]|uniref:SDR family oxidoreductase n=1 Tax=Thalassotalea euphylliae TaxID=1655234 RepID=A0A3E0U0E1_9GAMM|nr:SDR family oxidoreductase [Thalassotalea euphylliae]REL29552.1 SDR family oxidoreductase [Thalassotalea euphylliae]
MDAMLDFTGKTVLVTGASQGLGQLLSEALASRGANLVIGDIKEAELKAVEQSMSDKGYSVAALAGDVSQDSYCQNLAQLAAEKFGSLDIAVNNAGIAPALSPLHQTDEATMDKQFAVNVKGVQFGMKHQIPLMLSQGGGVILNVSSLAGLGGAPGVSSYAAAKHAVIGLTKTAAAEYGRYNIRVNAACPFFTLTNMVTDMSDDEDRKKMAKGAPMKRLAEPQEVVATMLLMLSPANTYMTGQSIAIDGGVTAL